MKAGIALLGGLAALLTAAVALAADPLDPRIAIDRADQAHAAAAVLERADLGPAWAGGARKPNSLKLPICPAYHPDDSDLTITGHAESVFNNGNGGIQIDSDAEVLKSARQVDVQFSRILQPKLATCLRYDLAKSVGGTNVLIGKATRLALPKVGSHSGLFRVSLLVKSGRSSVGVLSDFLYVAAGRTQFFVNIVAPASIESELGALEARIARTLVGKARV